MTKDAPEHRTGKPRTAAEEAVEELAELTERPDRRHERDAADAMTPNPGAQESVQRERRGGGRPARDRG
ncbi:hypothetical protein ABT104_33560 [Streptomyces mobaraensis]|uniref:hypothetical protein n=1 Tax=Streptomyces mobaraensis TaxID=35621 RepID=UPI00331FA78A